MTVMVAMYLLRRGLGLQEYLNDKVFNNLGLLFVAFTVIWTYFTVAEHITVWYGHEPSEMAVFWERVAGDYALVFWGMILVNTVIPLAVLSFRWGRKPFATDVVGFGVLIGIWIDRFPIAGSVAASPEPVTEEAVRCRSFLIRRQASSPSRGSRWARSCARWRPCSSNAGSLVWACLRGHSTGCSQTDAS
jgi:hypothetical protein